MSRGTPGANPAAGGTTKVRSEAGCSGEFTRRAVLNGKLDLIQAEAVGDLIEATAPAQVSAALRQLDGGLSRRLAALRESLVEVQALLSYNIDFPEEDDGPVSPERIASQIDSVTNQVRHLVATAPAAERLREGALLVFAGRPNAGKSSLFNALLGSARTLVTEIPGTTRDAVEAHTDFLGWPVRLADTAGLWDAPSEVDRLGVEVSRRYLAAADLVLFCVESGRDPGEDESAIIASGPTLLVRTKSDLSPGTRDGLTVSALSGEGLGSSAELRRSGCSGIKSSWPTSSRRSAASAIGRRCCGRRRRWLKSFPNWGSKAMRCLRRTTCGRQRPLSMSCSVQWILRKYWIGCLGVSALASKASYAVCIPRAASSAVWNSWAPARTASARPRSATRASVIR